MECIWYFEQDEGVIITIESTNGSKCLKIHQKCKRASISKKSFFSFEAFVRYTCFAHPHLVLSKNVTFCSKHILNQNLFLVRPVVNDIANFCFSFSTQNWLTQVFGKQSSFFNRKPGILHAWVFYWSAPELKRDIIRIPQRWNSLSFEMESLSV